MSDLLPHSRDDLNELPSRLGGRARETLPLGSNPTLSGPHVSLHDCGCSRYLRRE